MKKYLALLLAVVMVLSLAACGSKAEPSADQSTAAPIETDTKAYKVAIIKQLDHASLDEIRVLPRRPRPIPWLIWLPRLRPRAS